MTLFIGQNRLYLDFCLADVLINYILIKFLIRKNIEKFQKIVYRKIVFRQPRVLEQVFSMRVVLPPRECKLVHRRQKNLSCYYVCGPGKGHSVCQQIFGASTVFSFPGETGDEGESV